VAADLKRFLDGRPIVARRTSIPEKTLKWIRRNPATSALIVTASVAVIAATAGTAFHVTRLESELSRSERLLGGMTDFGAWLVREHVPRVARLRGGSEQQTELVDRTLQYLKQIQQDASADQELGEYVAQAYVQIADVQADPAFATPERIHQAIGSCENANELYGVILAQQTDARLLTEQAMILLRLSELHQRVQQLEDARTRADQAVALLASCTDERDTELLRAKRQSVSLTEDELTSEQAWLVYRQLHTDCSAPGDTSSNRTRLLAQLDLDLARVLLHANTDLSQHTTDSVADLYQQAVQHCQQISSPDVADDRLHAYALAELCNALVEQGDREEAARVMQTAVEIQRRIVVEIPESTIAMSTLLEYQRELLEVAAGDLIAKQTLADQYLDDAEQLYVRDPVTYRRDLQRAWLMVYRVNQQRKRYEAAHTNLRSAITLATTEVAESDSASANSNLAELMYLQAGLFREEINQRSTATQKLKLLKDAYAAVEEALRIYHQVKDPIDYEEDSTYWQAVSLSHELQEELEREELRLRESGNTSTEGRGKSPDGRPTE
jgi:tetratricopeptide (TPR) repeat protein